MTSQNGATRPIPRIESLRLKNFKVFHDLHLEHLTPLTVFIGPNASGKSTILEALAFLADAFTDGLERAIDARHELSLLQSLRVGRLGRHSPVTIEITYQALTQASTMRYRVVLGAGSDSEDPRASVVHESLSWIQDERKFDVLKFEHGHGFTDGSDLMPEPSPRHIRHLSSPYLLGAPALADLGEHPAITELSRFITSWRFPHLQISNMTRSVIEAQSTSLADDGRNLPNVLYRIQRETPDTFTRINREITKHISNLEGFDVLNVENEVLLLSQNEHTFKHPIFSFLSSEGTLRLLAYLVLLEGGTDASVLGIEEPETAVHPAILHQLSERFMLAADQVQMFVTTHAPRFLDALPADTVYSLTRDDDGYARATRAIDVPGIPEYLEAGGMLGDAWEQRMLEPPSRGGHVS